MERGDHLRCALLIFGSSLRAKYFEDEYAYITQSYYVDLVLTRQFKHQLWLDMPAIDLQPLPKCLIGMVFRVANLPMPGRVDAWRWYEHYHTFGGPSTLVAARLPIVLLGALGCLALFACGVVAKDARMGTVAALLLMVNPLYSLQAHRAMADVPCEAFMLSSLAVWLFMWVRVCGRGSPLAASVLPWLAGFLAGLSLLCKLNGFIGLGIVAACGGLTWLLPGLSIGRKLTVTVGTIVTVAFALVLAVALNPYFTAKPTGSMPHGHADASLQKRVGAVSLSSGLSPRSLRNSESETIRMTPCGDCPKRPASFWLRASAGSARSGPARRIPKFDTTFARTGGCSSGCRSSVSGSTRQCAGLGRASGRQAAGCAAVVVWAVCAWVVVTLYLPMAWDRYQLPIQSGNALLAAIGLASLWKRLLATTSSRRTREGYLSAKSRA